MVKDLKNFKVERESTPILDNNLTVPELTAANFIAHDSVKEDFTKDEIYSILQDNIIQLPKDEIDEGYLSSITLAIFIKSGKLYLISEEEPVLRKTDNLQEWVHDRSQRKIHEKLKGIPHKKPSDLTTESMSFLKVYLLGSEKDSFSTEELSEILSGVKEEYGKEVTIDYYYLDKLCQKMYSELGWPCYIKDGCIIKAQSEQDWKNNVSLKRRHY